MPVWIKVYIQANPGFRSMKRLGVFLLILEGTLVNRRVSPGMKFAGTQLYTWVKRDTVRVKCQLHNVPGQGSNPDCSIRGRAH